MVEGAGFDSQQMGQFGAGDQIAGLETLVRLLMPGRGMRWRVKVACGLRRGHRRGRWPGRGSHRSDRNAHRGGGDHQLAVLGDEPFKEVLDRGAGRAKRSELLVFRQGLVLRFLLVGVGVEDLGQGGREGFSAGDVDARAADLVLQQLPPRR